MQFVHGHRALFYQLVFRPSDTRQNLTLSLNVICNKTSNDHLIINMSELRKSINYKQLKWYFCSSVYHGIYKNACSNFTLEISHIPSICLFEGFPTFLLPFGLKAFICFGSLPPPPHFVNILLPNFFVFFCHFLDTIHSSCMIPFVSSKTQCFI